MEERYDEKYERAKKSVESKKGWYSHLLAYIFFITLEQLFYAGVFDEGRFTAYIPFWARCITPTIWGIAIILHWLYVFKGVRYSIFNKNWENRKIKTFMEQEERDF